MFQARSLVWAKVALAHRTKERHKSPLNEIRIFLSPGIGNGRPLTGRLVSHQYLIPSPMFTQMNASEQKYAVISLLNHERILQSSLMFASATTLAQRLRSWLKNASCCADVIVTTSAPCPASLARISGLRMILMISVLRRLMTAAGVPLATSKPCQVPDSKLA